MIDYKKPTWVWLLLTRLWIWHGESESERDLANKLSHPLISSLKFLIDYYKEPTWVWGLDYGCGMVKEAWWIRRQADPKRRSNELLSALKKTVVSHHETHLYGHIIEQHSYYNVTTHETSTRKWNNHVLQYPLQP